MTEGTAAGVFDAMASTYDEAFTHRPIARWMRAAVQRRMDARFPVGGRVLELGCGTGEDAVYLGRRGVRVLATDASSGMVRAAREKVIRNGMEAMVRVDQMAMEDLAGARVVEHLDPEGLCFNEPFDGALSNFGGINCVSNLAAVAEALAARLRPGAAALMCVMGPLALWEWGWFLIRGKPQQVFRRLGRNGIQWHGATIRYPRPAEIRRAFSPGFRLCRMAAIGLLLPPPPAENWAVAHPRGLECLYRWERRLETVFPLPYLSDHVLMEFERQ